MFLFIVGQLEILKLSDSQLVGSTHVTGGGSPEQLLARLPAGGEAGGHGHVGGGRQDVHEHRERLRLAEQRRARRARRELLRRQREEADLLHRVADRHLLFGSCGTKIDLLHLVLF